MKVEEITYKQAMKWCLEKHYARRKPMYQYAYGLVINGMIEGVVVYGRPPIQIEKKIKNSINDVTIFELTRLVVQTDKKNACSYLIGNSLKMLPKNNIVVSYSDTAMGHSGIVYQSTNWLYTGGKKAHDCEYIVDGRKMHPKTITERLGITAIAQWARENNIERIPPKIKHRYFFVNANKKDKKIIIKLLPYDIVKDYPKGEKQNYDAGEKITMEYKKTIKQKELF